MSRLAITGSSGFIGRRLVAAALAGGWAVRALVRDPSSFESAPGLDLCAWDAAERELPATAFEGVTAVCHLAAFLPADYSDPGAAEHCFRVNVLGTMAALKASVSAGVRRFVHFSSGNSYAPGLERATEDDPLFPSARAPYYLTSKVTSEVIVDHWRLVRPISACTLRLGAVYGPAMPARGVIPNFATRLMDRLPITLGDGGTYGADFVFVDDVVGAALAAVHSKECGPFNIGAGRRITVVELASELATLTGADPALIQLRAARSPTPDIGFPALDISRAATELGFVPTDLRGGLRAYLEWLASTRALHQCAWI